MYTELHRITQSDTESQGVTGSHTKSTGLTQIHTVSGSHRQTDLPLQAL